MSETSRRMSTSKYTRITRLTHNANAGKSCGFPDDATVLIFLKYLHRVHYDSDSDFTICAYCGDQIVHFAHLHFSLDTIVKFRTKFYQDPRRLDGNTSMPIKQNCIIFINKKQVYGHKT